MNERVKWVVFSILDVGVEWRGFTFVDHVDFFLRSTKPSHHGQSISSGRKDLMRDYGRIKENQRSTFRNDIHMTLIVVVVVVVIVVGSPRNSPHRISR